MQVPTEPPLRRCLFHIPLAIDPRGAVGSRVRPLGMLSGFREIGYQVDTIWGYAADRQRALETVRRNVETGVRYDFLYSESSTMPTLLTEHNHLPVHPFLDFGLFRFCQRAGIPVGLYYRDVYWRFEQYRQHVSWYKRMLTLPCYHLDLLAYRQWVDVLFLAHKRMLQYMRLWPRGKPVHELPPGAKTVRIGPAPSGGHLSLLYVGGVRPPLYDIGNLLDGVHRAVQGGVAVRLTICCPEEQWEARPESYHSWTGDWLTVVHLSGDDLQALYRQHHIAMVYLVPSPYRDFAIPVKLLEAIGFGRPVIAVEGTAVSDFVRQEGCGWAVSADPAALVALLRNLQTTPERIEEKTQITQHIRPNHSWAKRAEQVADILTTVGETRRHGGQA